MIRRTALAASLVLAFSAQAPNQGVMTPGSLTMVPNDAFPSMAPNQGSMTPNGGTGGGPPPSPVLLTDDANTVMITDDANTVLIGPP